MTADPPRRLSRGEHFDLARATADALGERVDSVHVPALLGKFGFIESEFTTWVENLLQGSEPDLIELAQYLGVGVPGDSGEQRETATVDAGDVNAYAELVSAETALRDVVRIAVPSWQDDLDAESIAKLTAKRTEEDKRRDGIVVSHDLLDYVEIYQLQSLLLKHWDEVKRVLDDRKRTEVYLGIILDIRNSIGHSRLVYTAERHLLAGVAGQIRNQLAVYRSKADGPARHYPSIDSARDDGGRLGFKNGHGLWGVDISGLTDIPRIEVGDTIVFEIEATDPRGRELTLAGYSVPQGASPASVVYGGSNGFFLAERGDRVRLAWKASEDDVGEFHAVQILLLSSSRYHRYKSWDDGVLFYYHVNPPPDA